MSKVSVIGLDGGTFEVIDYLIDRGRLPNFSRIISEGCRATLMSSSPPVTPAAWATFYTGANPGKHGAVDFFKRIPGTYKLAPVNAASIEAPSLWSLASELGKRVCIYNVPVTYPAAPVNGILISGMDAPGFDHKSIFPHEMRSDLAAAVPDFAIEPPLDARYLATHHSDPIAEYTHRLEAYLDVQIRTIRHLLELEDWDLFMAVIRSPDVFQHTFWRDVEEVMHEEESASAQAHKRAEAVFSCYEALDHELGEVWGSRDDRNLILMSDHGFGKLEKEVCLNRVLAGAGLLKFRKKRRRRAIKEEVLHGISGRMPVHIKNKLMQMLRQDSKVGMLYTDALIADIDWEGTYIYSIGQFGCLFTNLSGREPYGIVTGEKERQAVLSEAEAVLRELVDPEDGKPVMTAMHRREELYQGPLETEMPALVIAMRGHSYRGVYCTTAELESEALFRRPCPEWGMLAPTGCHRREGILVIHGPDARSGELDSAQIIDVAPTIMKLLGLGVPEHCDGRVLEGALSEEIQGRLRQLPVSQGLSSHARSPKWGYTDEEQEDVRRRLRDLGYI